MSKHWLLRQGGSQYKVRLTGVYLPEDVCLSQQLDYHHVRGFKSRHYAKITVAAGSAMTTRCTEQPTNWTSMEKTLVLFALRVGVRLLEGMRSTGIVEPGSVVEFVNIHDASGKPDGKAVNQ